MDTFSYGQSPHLFLDSDIIIHLLLLSAHLLHIFLSLLLVDLLLECFLHSQLLLFSLQLHHILFITTLPQDISVFFEVDVDSVLKYTSSSLDIWKVLLSDASIKVEVSIGVVGLVVLLVLWVDIEGLIVWVECLRTTSHVLVRAISNCFKLILIQIGLGRDLVRLLYLLLLLLLLLLLRDVDELGSVGLSPLFLLPQKVAFLDLAFQFVSEVALLLLFLDLLCSVGCLILLG